MCEISLKVFYSKYVDASIGLFQKLNVASFSLSYVQRRRRLSSLLAMTLQVRVCMYLYNATLCRLLLVDSDFPWDTKLSLDPFAKRSVPNPLVRSSPKTFPTNRTRGCNAAHRRVRNFSSLCFSFPPSVSSFFHSCV